jgi:hypothetical protein
VGSRCKWLNYPSTSIAPTHEDSILENGIFLQYFKEDSSFSFTKIIVL